MTRRPASRRCSALGCPAPVEGRQRLCGRCFKLLPFARRREIAVACQARAPHIVCDLVRDAVTWLTEHSPAAEAARRQGEHDRPSAHSFGAG